MKKIYLSLLLISLSFSISAQKSITSISAVSDSFTGFTAPTSGTVSSGAPSNWTLTAGGSNGPNWRGTNQSGGTSGGWYGNENLSFLGSGTANSANATWLLQNNTGQTLTGFTLSFTARMWRSGTASPTVTVSWQNSSSSSNPSGALTNSLSSCSFSDANTFTTKDTTLTQSVTGLTIANGQYIFIRFTHPGAGSSDNLGWDNVTFTPVGPTCTTPTELRFTTQPTSGQNIRQDSLFNVIVSATCSDGTVAASYNTGNIRLTYSGCKLDSTNPLTQNFVSGVATFTGIKIGRSGQNSKYLTATHSGSLPTVNSNTFNIIDPVGSTTVNTLKTENFEAASTWNYTTSSSTVGSGGSAGSDVTSIRTVSSNSFLSKSYSVNNASSERGSLTTITFDPVSITPSTYSNLKFEIKLGSSTGYSGTGAGNDMVDTFVLETQLNSSGTWSRAYAYKPSSGDMVFSVANTPTGTISYNSNVTYTNSTDPRYITISLPNSTTTFQFRVIARNNRTAESWDIDDLKLTGETFTGATPKPVPTVAATGGQICKGNSITINATPANTQGSVSYTWDNGGTLSSTSVQNPVSTPTATTSYNITATDGDGCSVTSTTPATVVVQGNNTVLTSSTLNTNVFCDVSGWSYYQDPSDLSKIVFAIKWDGDNDGTIDNDAKDAAQVTINVASNPYESNRSLDGSVLMKRFWNVTVPSGSMTGEPVSVKFYYDPAEITAIVSERNTNKSTAQAACGCTLNDVPFKWFKSVGTAFTASTISSQITGNLFTFNNMELTDANTSGATDDGILYAQFDNITSFSGGTGGVGYSEFSVALPVELLDFSVSSEKEGNQLNWSTASEKNSSVFEVEYSTDAISFEKIGEVKAAGNSSSINEYTYFHTKKAPTAYYRLKMIDKDGSYTYSKKVAVNDRYDNNIFKTDYNNEVVSILSSTETTVNIRLYNSVGQMLFEKTESVSKGNTLISVPVNTLPAGIYILSASDSRGNKTTQKISK